MATKSRPVSLINEIISEITDTWTDDRDKVINKDTGSQLKALALMGRPRPESVKLAVGRASKARPRTKEEMERLHATVRGRPLSDAHKAAISKKLKGRVLSEETLRKVAESKKAKPMSEEGRAKLSIGAKQRFSRAVSIDGVVYESITTASETLNIGMGQIAWRLKSKTEMCKTYFYVDEGPKAICAPKTRGKEFVLFDPEGVEYRGTNVVEFCKTRGLNAHTVAQVCKGTRDQVRGWTGHYVEQE
jgi:hypothetical protein